MDSYFFNGKSCPTFNCFSANINLCWLLASHQAVGIKLYVSIYIHKVEVKKGKVM